MPRRGPCNPFDGLPTNCYSIDMNELQIQLERICRDYDVVSLYAFGSRAEEIAARVAGRPAALGPAYSDLDVGVQPTADGLRGVDDRVRLTQALENLFDVARVDLVILPQASPFLVADAVRGELLFCDDEDRQSHEELYYLRRAADLAPFQRDRLEGLLSGEYRR